MKTKYLALAILLIPVNLFAVNVVFDPVTHDIKEWGSHDPSESISQGYQVIVVDRGDEFKLLNTTEREHLCVVNGHVQLKDSQGISTADKKIRLEQIRLRLRTIKDILDNANSDIANGFTPEVDVTSFQSERTELLSEKTTLEQQ